MCCICIERVEDNAYSLYDNDLYYNALAQEPQPRCYTIYNFGRPFFGRRHYNYIN